MKACYRLTINCKCWKASSLCYCLRSTWASNHHPCLRCRPSMPEPDSPLSASGSRPGSKAIKSYDGQRCAPSVEMVSLRQLRMTTLAWRSCELIPSYPLLNPGSEAPESSCQPVTILICTRCMQIASYKPYTYMLVSAADVVLEALCSSVTGGLGSWGQVLKADLWHKSCRLACNQKQQAT